jgi:peptide/nickel transport system substrate-binding protein
VNNLGKRYVSVDGLSRLNSSAIRQALVLAALTILVLISACARNEPPTPQPQQGGALPGVLRFAEIDEPDGLNPLIASQPIALDLSYLMFSYFFNIDDKSNLVPEIATEVPTMANSGVSRDGKTITYHLRRGVKWQDGEPLTARDVVFTYQAIMNPKNNIQGQLGYINIASVVAPDDYTVVVHMKRVDSEIVALFMGIDADYPILPAHLLAKYPDLNHVPYNDKPVGSGPFRVTEWVKGDHIVFEANTEYWRGSPKLDRIVIFFVHDNAQIIDRIRAGTIDAWFRSDPTLYPALTQIPGFSVIISPDNTFGHLDFNLRDPMLQDVRVRRAIEMAIDRRKIVHDVTHYVYQTTDSDQPYSSWAYDRNLPRVNYDPAGARTLLTKAGWTRGADGALSMKGHKLSLQLAFLSGSVIDQEIADLIKADLGAIGIELIQRPYPSISFLASKQAGGIIYNGKYQLASFRWVSGINPDDSWLFSCNQQPPVGENSTFWCDRKVDAAEDDALATFDIERRKRDYAIVQTEVAEQVPMIYLFSQRRADVYSERFSGFKPSPSFAYWNSWEWQMR